LTECIDRDDDSEGTIDLMDFRKAVCFGEIRIRWMKIIVFLFGNIF